MDMSYLPNLNIDKETNTNCYQYKDYFYKVYNNILQLSLFLISLSLVLLQSLGMYNKSQTLLLWIVNNHLHLISDYTKWLTGLLTFHITV